jgi:3-oxoacyl-[acyl-carrier protein] reductase
VGGRGIGRAYCERLASDGANIVIVDKGEVKDLAAR